MKAQSRRAFLAALGAGAAGTGLNAYWHAESPGCVRGGDPARQAAYTAATEAMLVELRTRSRRTGCEQRIVPFTNERTIGSEHERIGERTDRRISTR